MAKLTDVQIRTWIKSGEHFDGRSDGGGLYLCFPKNYSIPFWRFRYRFAGKQRAMVIGTYSELSLAKAREAAREQSARVALGYDVAGEKQERKAEALKKMEEEKHATTVENFGNGITAFCNLAGGFFFKFRGKWWCAHMLRLCSKYTAGSSTGIGAVQEKGIANIRA